MTKRLYDPNDYEIPKGYMIARCAECGNEGLHKITATYNQTCYGYADEEPGIIGYIKWTLLECPICHSISLSKALDESISDEVYTQEEIVYPPARKIFPNTPNMIVKAYEAAIETLKGDLDISLIAVRRVLEMICKERGCKRKTLESMLKDMVNKNILPKTLDQCSLLIRKMGNKGAHGEVEYTVAKYDIEELIHFIETILYYIYELPKEVERLKTRYDIRDDSNDGERETDNSTE